VLPSVLAALRQARGSDCAPTLLSHLDHRDVFVRAAAADELRELGGADPARVLEAFSRAASDTEPDARIALVRLLGAVSEQAGGTLLRELASSDRDAAVRREAGAVLAGRGDAPPDPVMSRAPALHPDDVEAMLAYDPRQGEPLFSPRAVLHTSKGEVEIALDLIEVPLATAAFVARAKRGYYDGLDFHRFVPAFVVQGGCPRGDGYGGPGYSLPSEPGTYPYGRGAVGIANGGPDTDGSQFFVTLTPQPQLDGVYTQLGRVTRGLEVVDQIRPGDVIRRVEIWDGR
jgi:cyclophilin family peptidyl-prolyl cis-trans isomerase